MRTINMLPALLLATPALAMEQHMDAMPVAKLAVDHLEQRFDGDEQARSRPLDTVLDALRALGADIDGSGLPFTPAATSCQQATDRNRATTGRAMAHECNKSRKR